MTTLLETAQVWCFLLTYLSLLGVTTGFVRVVVTSVPTTRGYHVGKVVVPTAVVGTTSGLSLATTPSVVAAAAPIESVQILPDAQCVGAELQRIVRQAAKESISERGYFALAIPGGSILKMLVGTGGKEDDWWTSKTTLVYVNHKCVPMDDENLATHAKACKLFLNGWTGCNTIVMDGTDDGSAEAASYEAKLKSLPVEVLPISASNGLPLFDLALIGVGDDGHVGSLYPGRQEVLVGDDKNGHGPWVLPVDMKAPPSITLSLPVMAAARKVVVAACGVSDKYPQGKSDGMRRAIAATEETVETFPAVGLRSVATWILDEAAASKLGADYNKK